MREIVIDTETTGLDPLDGHRIVEIGAVELVDRAVTGNTFHRYLSPERAVPADALAVHGLTAEFLADKPLFGAIADEFLAFVGDAPLVAHNAGFDGAFLNAELKRTAKLPIGTERVIDTAGAGATQAFRRTTSGLHCARSSGERSACTRCTIWRGNSGAWDGLCLGHNGLIPATKLGQLQLLRCTDLNRLRGPAILTRDP